MSKLRAYPARCGVCQREHTVLAGFLSVAQSYADGRLRVNCEGDRKHTPDEVRAAWAAWTQQEVTP